MRVLLILLLSCTGKDDGDVNSDSVAADDSQVTGDDSATDDSASDDSAADDSATDDSATDDSATDDSAADDSSAPVDGDGDGFTEDQDCDDAEPSVHPGAAERCDGVDQDCDSAVDEGVTQAVFDDADGDGYGDSATRAEACEPGEGQVAVEGDCDDREALIFPEADGSCAVGLTCASLLALEPSSADGSYLLDPDGSQQGFDPVNAYCDMLSGGWMLVGRQRPEEQLTKTADDIHIDSSWSEAATHRWGTVRLATLSPTIAWRITSDDASNGARVDDAFFSPACVIDWEAYVGTWRGERADHYDDCGLAYSDEGLTAAISPHTENNCSLGIGQNNSGAYCSMRMGSCNCYGEACTSTWAAEEGVAAPCAFEEWESVVMSLWVK